MLQQHFHNQVKVNLKRFLSILKEKPWNAYELTIFLQENELNNMIKISIPSVYKNLVKLAGKGYLKVDHNKEGNMPEKKIYNITKKGEEYHKKLLEEIMKKDFGYFFDFNVGILNLSSIDKDNGVKLLNNLLDILYDKKKFYEERYNKYKFIPYFGLTIIEQSIKINNTMIAWLEDLISKKDDLDWGKGLSLL